MLRPLTRDRGQTPVPRAPRSPKTPAPASDGPSVRGRRSGTTSPARRGCPAGRSVRPSHAGGVQRAAEAGHAGAGGDVAAVAPSPSRRREVEPARHRVPSTKAPGGVVGDGVGEADVPAGDPAVDDLDRRRARGRWPGSRRPRWRGAVEVVAEDEGDLGLDARLQEPLRKRLPVGEGHVGEQRAEVGLVDAQLGLHGRRGQAGLPARRTCSRMSRSARPASPASSVSMIAMCSSAERTRRSSSRSCRNCIR